jgi:hypothetical protein
MDEEIGYAVGSNVVLARSGDRQAAIVLRGLSVFTAGLQTELTFANREASVRGDFERWDTMDTSENGALLGFAFGESAPVLSFAGRSNHNAEPPWFTNALWGGTGGSEGDAFNVRHLRAQTAQPAPGNAVTIGWSWRERGIESGTLTIGLPEPDEIKRYVRSIWD